MKVVSWLLTFLYQSLRVLLFLLWLFLISTYFIKPPADMNSWSAPHFMLLILYPATLLLHRLLKGRLFATSLYKNYILFTYFVNECFAVGLQHKLVLLFLSNREKAFNSEGLGAGFLTVLLFWLFGWLAWGKSERKKVIKETRANFQAIPGSKPFPVSELIPWLWETPLLNHKSKFNNHSFSTGEYVPIVFSRGKCQFGVHSYRESKTTGSVGSSNQGSYSIEELKAFFVFPANYLDCIIKKAHELEPLAAGLGLDRVENLKTIFDSFNVTGLQVKSSTGLLVVTFKSRLGILGYESFQTDEIEKILNIVDPTAGLS